MSDEPKAFTSTFPGISLRLVNRVVVAMGQASIEVPALWDTGATKTSIASEVATALGLVPFANRDVLTPSGPDTLPLYMVDMRLPSGELVERLEVIGSEIGRQGIGVLVGMDVISLGDFACSCREGRTMFSFRTPSVEDANFLAGSVRNRRD